MQLSREESELCSFSPAEIALYYMVYPQQLIRDATDQGRDVMEYFNDAYQTAIEYMLNKYSS